MISFDGKPAVIFCYNSLNLLLALLTAQCHGSDRQLVLDRGTCWLGETIRAGTSNSNNGSLFFITWYLTDHMVFIHTATRYVTLGSQNLALNLYPSISYQRSSAAPEMTRVAIRLRLSSEAGTIFVESFHHRSQTPTYRMFGCGGVSMPFPMK